MIRTTLILGGALLASMASAYDLQYSHLSPGGSGSVILNGNTKNVGIGILNFNRPSPQPQLSAVCAELTSTLNSSFHVYDRVIVGAGSTNLDMAARIVSKHFLDAKTDNKKAMGLQLAVWEALYDGGGSYSSMTGNFKTTGLDATASSWAATYYSAYLEPGQAYFYSSTAAGSQDQLTPVPEPATMAGLAIGALALARRRRKSA